jgi:chromosomal replication initiation ATPase DnaA
MKEEVKEHIKTLSAWQYSLLNTICDYSNIKLDDLIGQKRHRKFVNARKIASYLLHNNGYAFHDIGKIISIIPKDHTSILYHVRLAKEHIETEPLFKNIVDSVNNLIVDNKFDFTALNFKGWNN